MRASQVWALRCDMHVLDHGGNLVDACMLCALAACLAFRRPEVLVGGGPSGTGAYLLFVHLPSCETCTVPAARCAGGRGTFRL